MYIKALSGIELEYRRGLLVDDSYDFSGRIGRAEWAIINCICMIVSFILTWRYVIFEVCERYASMEAFIFYVGMGFLLCIWSAACVKRLHDIGVDGRHLLWALLPGIGVIYIIGRCGFQPGDECENLYGSPREFKVHLPTELR